MSTADISAALRNPQSANRMMADARDNGLTLSLWMERLQPSEQNDQLDAFERLMQSHNIISRTVHDYGINASPIMDLFEKGGRAVFEEWCWRSYRFAQSGQRAPMMTSDSLLGSNMKPYAVDDTVRRDGFTAAVPVSEVLASSRGIVGANFQGSYLIEPAASEKRFVRISEGAEIPKAQVRLGDRVLTIYKFGRGIELTYEVMRRERLDRLRTWVQELAVQQEIDKLAAIIDVLVNGDGNSNTTPTTYNLSTLDPAADGDLTVLAWLTFLGKFKNPYQADIALAKEAGAMAIKMLNTGSANLPVSTLLLNGSQFVPSVRPINRTLSPSIGLGETDDAPTDKIIAIDSRVAVERVFEVGADIQENERHASRQTESVYFTEVEGYQTGRANANGTKILDLAA